MTHLNIGGDKEDKFYRYKMPPVMSKIEGRGNGIKTVIPNMSDIAKALHRPAAYPTKYFGCELGAQVKYEEKNDRYIVNGAHDAMKLQECLDGFIKKFVLCPACGNPETDLSIQKNGDILRQCKACGQVSPVDMRHKLVNFILNNPPDGAPTSGKKGRKNKKLGTGSPENGKAGDKDAEDEGDSDDEHRRIQEEVMELGKGGATLDDDDWVLDMSPAAIENRQRAMAVSLEKMGLESDGDEESDPLDLLEEYIKANADASDKDILAKIKSLHIAAHKATLVLVQTLFDDNLLTQLPKRAHLFTTLHNRNERAQKYFLGGLERLVAVAHPDALLKKMPLALKVVYDEDIADEEVILAWGEKASKKFVGKKKLAEQVRTFAEPFLKWLKEAEDEEDDDEE